MYDIQKAPFSKRVSAFLFDVIIFFIMVVGVGSLFSGIIGYDTKSEAFEEITKSYTQEYIYDEFNSEYGTALKPEEIDKKLNEDYAKYEKWYTAQVDAANKVLREDKVAMELYSEVITLSILNITISILVSHLVLEFVVPLLFGNGQTFGKKIFGVALMRIDGVKISPLQLAVRTILGKFTIETMIPVLVVLSVYFSIISPDLVLLAIAVLGALIIAEAVIFFKSNMSDLIHDKMALTLCVDFQSQLIFENEEALIEYKATHATETVGTLSHVAESLFSVYSRVEKPVEPTPDTGSSVSHSGIQLGSIDIDEPGKKFDTDKEEVESREDAAPEEDLDARDHEDRGADLQDDDSE